MTDLHIEGTPDEVVRPSPGAWWGRSESASSVFGAELAGLNLTELTELRRAVAAGARTGDDGDVDWSARAERRIVAELYRRTYLQAATDAKAAAIIDEERRLACEAR